MDKDKAQAMVFASFIGDALALGPHWIYDPNEIVARFGRITGYTNPPEGGYHSGKKAGEFTHYGDQTLVLLRSVSEKQGFDLQDFSTKWQELFKNYRGYTDQATAMTLENFRKGKPPEQSGSTSDDLAGASRISPLVYIYRDDIEALLRVSRVQTAMTHAAPITIQAAIFFSTLAYHVLHGENPGRAIEDLIGDTSISSEIRSLADKGLHSTHEDTIAAMMRFGQSCHGPEAFPCVIHVLGKYTEDLPEALIQSTMAGGDSAGRNMLIGMILGAYLGMDSIPKAWVAELAAGPEISGYLEMMR